MQPDDPAQGAPPAHTADSASNAIAQEIERLVGTRNYQHWFCGSTSLKTADDVLTVGVGSPFLLSWMQKQFRASVAAAAQAVLGPSARINFEVDAKLLGQAGALASSRAPGNPKKLTPQAEPTGEPARNGRRFAALADFVEGSCNRLPLTAAHKVCESPGAKFNPLFLHGLVGTGKTHLLEGIYSSLRRQFPALNVMFLTAEAFANYFTEALREHKLPGFRRRFRNVDVLIVDDVDFLCSKKVIQEEFLHTIKQLESHQRQIIVAADSHPRLLEKMSDDLSTRFLSGLVCRLESPDRETRRKIVDALAARLDADISPEALAFVAQRFTGNVRELIGALNCLETYCHMTLKRVGLTAARHVLADLERDCVRITRISDVEEVVCTFFGLGADDLKSPRRNRSVSQPRMLAMYLARKHTQAAYREIGSYFGGRNHSTVKAAEQKVAHWLEDQTSVNVATQSWQMQELVEALEQQIRAS
ncbi:MAG: chromosomal replication initiator protein DnaA [Planctomycetaceae bacterium]